jgi:hypothetical protein
MLSLAAHSLQFVSDPAAEHVLHMVTKGCQAPQMARPGLATRVRILTSGKHEVNGMKDEVHWVGLSQQPSTNLSAGSLAQTPLGCLF